MKNKKPADLFIARYKNDLKSGNILHEEQKNKIPPKKQKRPEFDKYWTTLYYGARGSFKSNHQAKEVLKTMEWLDWLYFYNPKLKPAIVYSIQRFNKKIEEKYLGRLLYYWNEGKDLRYCPRTDCWRGKERHRLHGCYLIFDDIATILPADNWTQTPIWLRKTFAQARHNGVRICANLQDPFSVDINFRRYVDMAYRFRYVFKSRDIDETKKPIKFIFGIYHRRKIKAELLWKSGDMGEEDIKRMRAQQKEMDKVYGTSLVKEMWKGSLHWSGRTACNIYDTTQDVPEYKPAGFAHTEFKCIDPRHNHTDKDAPNYCNYRKVSHELE